MSNAKACGASDEKRRAAKVALDGMEFNVLDLGSLLRLFSVMKNFLLEKREKGVGTGLVVFGVGILVPKKLEEESNGLVIDAIVERTNSV